MSSLRSKFALGHSSIKICSHEPGVPIKTKKNQKRKFQNLAILKILWSVRNFNGDKFLSKTTRNRSKFTFSRIFLSNMFLIAKASTMTLSFPNILILNIREIVMIISCLTSSYHFGSTILNSGRFEKLLGFARSHSILTRGSNGLSCATPHPSCFSKS